MLIGSTVQVSFPRPRPGVMNCNTVRGIEKIQAAIAQASSHLRWRAFAETVTRIKEATKASAPDTIATYNRTSLLSRIGAPHIVDVVLTALSASLTVHDMPTQPCIAAFIDGDAHMHGKFSGAHSVWFPTADMKHLCCELSAIGYEDVYINRCSQHNWEAGPVAPRPDISKG